MAIEDGPIGLTVSALKRAFLENLVYIRGKHPRSATRHDYYMALAYTVRDQIVERWVSSAQDLLSDPSVVVYLSAEYLPGPQLVSNLLNLGILAQKGKIIESAVIDSDRVCAPICIIVFLGPP